MDIPENFGGYKKIEFVSRDKIQSMSCSVSSSTVTLFEHKEWVSIPSQYGTSVILNSPHPGESGVVHESNVTVFIPHHLLTEDLQIKIQTLCLFGGVVRYTTHDDIIYIIGCKDFPLRAIFERIHPGKVSGFKCAKLEFSGKSHHSQRIYK